MKNGELLKEWIGRNDTKPEEMSLRLLRSVNRMHLMNLMNLIYCIYTKRSDEYLKNKSGLAEVS